MANLEHAATATGVRLQYGAAWIEFGVDGTIAVSPGAGQALTETGGGYDAAAFLAGAPGADAILLRHVAARAFSLPASLTGSKANAAVAATASTVLTVKKNGSSIGTITFAIAGTTGTFAAAAATSFAVGDVLSVVAPHAPDATLADIALTLKGALA